jgi:hypothetical protein
MPQCYACPIISFLLHVDVNVNIRCKQFFNFPIENLNVNWLDFGKIHKCRNRRPIICLYMLNIFDHLLHILYGCWINAIKKKLGIHEDCIEIVIIFEDQNGLLKLGKIVS